MTNVSNLSVSLRRKTDDSPYSVAQTYWIKKDVSPLFRSQKTARHSETRKEKTDARPWYKHGLFLCFGVGYLAVPLRRQKRWFVLLDSIKVNTHYSIT